MPAEGPAPSGTGAPEREGGACLDNRVPGGDTPAGAEMLHRTEARSNQLLMAVLTASATVRYAPARQRFRATAVTAASRTTRVTHYKRHTLPVRAIKQSKPR